MMKDKMKFNQCALFLQLLRLCLLCRDLMNLIINVQSLTELIGKCTVNYFTKLNGEWRSRLLKVFVNIKKISS